MEEKTEIFNLSAQNMPNFLGFRTTFNIPFVEGSVVEGITVKADLGDEIERDMKIIFQQEKYCLRMILSVKSKRVNLSPLKESLRALIF